MIGPTRRENFTADVGAPPRSLIRILVIDSPEETSLAMLERPSVLFSWMAVVTENQDQVGENGRMRIEVTVPDETRVDPGIDQGNVFLSRCSPLFR